MQGGDKYGAGAPGLMHLAADHIFSVIEARSDTDFLLRVSYLEVYNEQLRDLLAEDGTGEVHIREHPETGVYVEGAQETVVTQPHDMAEALVQGEKRRAVGSTAMNERSSRSHTVFRIVVESRPRECAEDHGVLVGAISLVDLAGSESVRLTGATGVRQKEGGKINQSLLTLSRVVQQLGEKGKENFVNFRDSRLTRLLQPTLSGKAQLAMVCCVAPSCNYVEETRSTLQFGSRAARVTLKPVVHEILDDASQLRRVKRQLAELLAKQEQHERDQASGKTEELADLLEKNEKLEADLAQRAAKMTELTKMICVGGHVAATDEAAAAAPRDVRRRRPRFPARGRFEAAPDPVLRSIEGKEEGAGAGRRGGGRAAAAAAIRGRGPGGVSGRR
jgi:centromeric protein E